MDELLAGSNNVSASSVARMGSPYKNAAGSNYMMAPTSMTMDMHMLMGMYSQANNLSWMVMLNYLDNEMNMLAMNGSRPVMNASGIGDVQIGAMYKVYDNGPSQLLANIGVSLPTGSINKTNNQGILPYAMQLGSGTFDLIPSLTYQGSYDVWSWGLQASYVFRLNENSQNYALGNRADGQLWVKATPLKNTSITGRASLSHWGNISGSASAITMMQRNMSPTFDTRNSGGDRLDLSIGLSQLFDSGHMLGFEYGIPVQQNLDGLQMKVKQVYSVSWQYMF
ncbi:MAG: transporter [Mariprofundus sp.]|nr:transporter [Mariprofundus sp.]